MVCAIQFCFALFAGRRTHGEKPGEQSRDPKPAPLPTLENSGQKKTQRREKCVPSSSQLMEEQAQDMGPFEQTM